MRYMYDSVSPSSIPASATIVAGYENGLYANMAEMATRFPRAIRVPISVTASHDGGIVLDVETGDATPGEAPGWVKMRRAAGADPTVYCNSSTWSAVRAAFRAAGVPEPHYWIAAYDGNPVIPSGAIAKQYENTSGWDVSVVADFWPGVDAPSQPTNGEDMPYWESGPVAPGAAPTTVLPPCGSAWSATTQRMLHLGFDQIGSPNADASVRVSFHNATGWSTPRTVTVPAAAGRVDIGFTPDVQKISLQSETSGVAYAVEVW